jgi:hypothetical protein
MTNHFEARVASLGPTSEPCAHCICPRAGARRVCPRPSARRVYLLLATILFGSLAGPALGNMYSCQDVAGRIILRDVPCKRGERSREPGAPAWRPKAPSSQSRAAGNADQISEGQVQALVDGMDAATARHDVTAILGYLASDAVWEVEYRLPQGLQFMRLNKDEYAARLRDRAPLKTAYPPERENTRILVAPGARYAELTTTLRETIWIKGEPLSGVTRSKSMVEMRDGRPLITLVRATTTFDVPEGKDSPGKQKGRAPDSRR